MTHRRSKQIERAHMISNTMVLFGIDIELPDGTFEFVEAKDLAEWQEKNGYRVKVSGTEWHKENIVL